MTELQRDKHLDRVFSTLWSRLRRRQMDSVWCIWARYTYRKRQFHHADLLIRRRRARHALCRTWESISLYCCAERDKQKAVDRSALVSQFLKTPRRIIIVFTKSFGQWAALSARYRTLFHAAACVSRKATKRLLTRSFAEVQDVATHRKTALRGIVTSWRRTAVKFMRSAFQAWLAFRLHQVKLRHAARLLITRACKMVVQEKFLLWLENSARSKIEARALLVQNAHLHQKATRIWTRIVTRNSGMAFRLWAHLCEQKQHMKVAAENLHALFIYRLKLDTFDSLQAYVRKESNLRARLGRVISCLDTLSFAPRGLCGDRLRLIMRSWRKFIVDKKYDRQMRDDIVAEWLRNIKTRVFIAMLDHVAHSKQAKMQRQQVEAPAQ